MGEGRRADRHPGTRAAGRDRGLAGVRARGWASPAVSWWRRSARPFRTCCGPPASSTPRRRGWCAARSGGTAVPVPDDRTPAGHGPAPPVVAAIDGYAGGMADIAPGGPPDEADRSGEQPTPVWAAPEPAPAASAGPESAPAVREGRPESPPLAWAGPESSLPGWSRPESAPLDPAGSESAPPPVDVVPAVAAGKRRWPRWLPLAGVIGFIAACAITMLLILGFSTASAGSSSGSSPRSCRCRCWSRASCGWTGTSRSPPAICSSASPGDHRSPPWPRSASTRARRGCSNAPACRMRWSPCWSRRSSRSR